MAWLILDDDALLLDSVVLSMDPDIKLIPVNSYSKAVSVLEQDDIEGAIIDVNLGPDCPSGKDFLRVFKEKYPDKPVIMQSGYRELSIVVDCMKLGADDFIEKPYGTESLKTKIQKAGYDNRKNRVLRRAFDRSLESEQIVGSSLAIQKAVQLTEQAGRMRILFCGETGVGKTPFALLSNRVVGREVGGVRPFEQINCAALNHEQFQDALFGHKKGAFTNAIADKKGLVELAEGGDLFLDEIGEMPLETQALFLTFLDSMEYYRLGDDKKRKANVRIISATNRDLKDQVQKGKFRKDLYSRISQVVVEIPPLRDRVSDIPEIFEHFILKFAGYRKSFDPEILRWFQDYNWEEGNVRELKDAVEYLCIMARNSERIELSHLSDRYKPMTQIELTSDSIHFGDFDNLLTLGLEDYLAGVEKRLLENYVKSKGGNLENLSLQLKMSKPTLYRRLKKYGISLSTLN